MLKRMALFLLINILVMTTISIVVNVLGVGALHDPNGHKLPRAHDFLLRLGHDRSDYIVGYISNHGQMDDGRKSHSAWQGRRLGVAS